MKYLKKFFNVNYYNQFINKRGFKGPNISLMMSDHGVRYVTEPRDEEEQTSEITIPGFTILEYISSTETGGQYIDLGCKLMENTDDIQIDIKFNHHGAGKQVSNSNGNKQYTLIGSQLEASPYPGFVLRKTASNNYVEFMTKWQISNSGIKSNNYNYYYSYYLPGDIMNLDGGIKYSYTPINNIHKVSFTLDNIPVEQCHQMNTHLFCGLDSNNNPWRFAYADIYYMKITKGSQVIRDLLPVKRNSDNAVGLYDIENGVFYQSQSSEPFVPHYKVSIYRNIYKKLEYIKTTRWGGQYLDLGYALFANTDDMQIDIKFNCVASGYDDVYGTKRATVLTCENPVSPYEGFILCKDAYREQSWAGSHYVFMQSYYEYNDFIEDDSGRSDRAGMYVSKYMNGKIQSDTYGTTNINTTYERTFILNNMPQSQIHNNPLLFFVYKNRYGSYIDYSETILYYLTITKGNQIIFDLIPVERITDNKLGLYDKQHDIFYEFQYGREDYHEPLIQGEYIN